MTKDDLEHNDHFKRILFYDSNIDNNRQDRCDQSKTLKGTRKVHAVKSVQDMVISTRSLSYFCSGCVGNDSECLNSEYMEDWKLDGILKSNRRGLTEQTRERGRCERRATQRGKCRKGATQRNR